MMERAEMMIGRIAGAMLAALLLSGATPVVASPAGIVRVQDGAAVSTADQSAIRGVIANQLQAFQRDDGVTAFSFASPRIRELFKTPENFMAMVARGYAPVYRPRSVAFADLVQSERGPVQRVALVGPDGKPVMALYSMEKQPDGSWKISGCVLVALPGTEA